MAPRGGGMLKTILATIFIFSYSSAQAQETKDQFSEPKEISSSIGQRRWFVDPSFALALIIGNKYKPDQGQSRNRNGQSIDLAFGYNFSEFEVGPIIRYSNYDYESSTETSMASGLFGDFNFIENKPGVELIPFLRASFVHQKDKDSRNLSGFEDETQYDTYGLSTGVKWFPVGDFFAVKGYLEYYQNNVIYKEASSQDFKYTISGPRLRAEFAIYL